ncbi:MAG: TlpA disulfide reductase family protein [Bacteroidia bacterium]|nr:TlpA disulfide reductase family protein [Bacteroidia bacterium]
MKTSLFIFVAFLILVCSCTSQEDKIFKKYTLQGEINSQDSGIIVLIYRPDETIVYDTAKIENNKFVFTGKIYEPTRAELNGGNDLKRVFVFLEPGKMKISLSGNNYKEHKIIGSKTQNDYDLLQKLEAPFHERISLLRVQYNNINDSIENSKNDSTKSFFENKAAEINKLLSQTKKEIDSIEIGFVLENPKSFLSVVNLYRLAGDKISLDSAKSFLNGLDNTLKKSIYGKTIAEDIRKKENNIIGAQAPDFKATDLNQQTVTLSQFKGKGVVLLDFWASWCVPCRQSIPYLKKVYNKYHSKGFEVIAVSLDMNREKWIEAVQQDSTGMWYHIPIAEKYADGPKYFTENDIYQNYFVEAIPIQILIDKDGKIIKRLMGESKENEESLDKMLIELFDN